MTVVEDNSFSTLCKNCNHTIRNHYRDHEGGIWCHECSCHNYEPTGRLKKVIPLSEIDSEIEKLVELIKQYPEAKEQQWHIHTDVLPLLRKIRKKAIPAITFEKIDALIENIQTTTLIPTQQLDITQATDMIRDYFIKALEDLKK